MLIGSGETAYSNLYRPIARKFRPNRDFTDFQIKQSKCCLLYQSNSIFDSNTVTRQTSTVFGLMMRKLVTTSLFCLAVAAMSQTGIAQDLGGGGGGGGGGQQGSRQVEGGFEGRERATTREDIVDTRNETENITLGGSEGAANNFNFLNTLFGGNVGNQNVNQNQAIRGRGIRAPFRLGFKFDGMPLDVGIKNLNARIVRLPKFKNSKITGVLQQKTLLLVGEVASQQEASLAVRIARFEPGVDQVKSLLTVAKPGN